MTEVHQQELINKDETFQSEKTMIIQDHDMTVSQIKAQTMQELMELGLLKEQEKETLRA